tara:strand:+ start:523 stop:876 length:354 start_codon:yes stop_codon:yes gene_type:complete
MQKPIFASQEHKMTIEPFMNACFEFAEEVSTKSKYKNYLDIVKDIIDYHNGFGNESNEDYYNWLMIIPINLSVATTGFFVGVETKRNSAIIRAYSVVLNEMLHNTVDRLKLLKLENE